MSKNLINTENGVGSSISQDKVNNSNLYLDETDSNGVPLLRRIEKYPDLPDNEFIPIEYTHSNGLKILNGYSINKLGEVKNKKGKLIKGSSEEEYYTRIGLLLSDKKSHGLSIHRLSSIYFFS